MDLVGSLCVFFLATSILVAEGCDSGWETFGGKCYYFKTDEINFSDAMAACESKGAYITDITSVEESDWLKTTAAKQGGKGYWIGIVDPTGKGCYVYPNNYLLATPHPAVTVFDWAPKEPDMHLDEKCMLLYKPHQYKMHNNHCLKRYWGYICKK